MLKVSFYISCVISIGAVYFASAKEIGDPHECEDYGIKLPKDKVVSIPGKCMSAECVNPWVNEIVYTKCQKLEPGPGCHNAKEDNTKPYPDCCPKRVCKDESA